MLWENTLANDESLPPSSNERLGESSIAEVTSRA